MNLEKKTFKNLSMMATLKVVARILNAITLVVLARLLLPSDFGVVGISVVFINIVDQFRDFGFSAAIIHRRNNIEPALITGFSMKFVLSIVLFFVVFFSAPIWASFYDNPDITPVIRAIAIILIIDSLVFIPQTQLTKELKFKLLIIPDVLGRITYSIVAILLAYSGFSYWSLVYARILQSLVTPFALWVIRPWRFKLSYTKGVAKELFVYGRYIFLTSIMTFALLNLDNIVIGKILGMSVLGYYLIAYRWASLSSTEVTMTINQVMFPTYSRLNEDHRKIGSAYLKVLKYSSMVSIPLALGTLIVSREFVITVLGEKWTPTILPLQILCIFGLLQSIGLTTNSVYLSIGKPNIPAYLNAIRLVLLAIFIIPLARIYGTIGVAVLLSLINMIIVPITFSLLATSLSMRKKQFIQAVLPQTFSSIFMVLFIFILKTYNGQNIRNLFTSPWTYLIFLISIGVVTYIVFLFCLTKGKLKDDLRLFTSHIISK